MKSTKLKTNHSIFTAFTFVLFFFLFICPPSSPRLHAGNQFTSPPSSQNSDISITFQVGAQMSSECILVVKNLLQNLAGFEGAYCTVSPSADQQQLTFSVTGPFSQLPAQTDVATLLVADPTMGFVRTFRVKTDGGSVLLVLGDF